MLAHLHALSDRTALAARSGSGPPRSILVQGDGFQLRSASSARAHALPARSVRRVGADGLRGVLCRLAAAALAEDDRAFRSRITEMIMRDRNHPSVVMWGLLNETSDGPVFRHAVDMLPLVRSLDDTRVVMLNSGLFTFVDTAVRWRAFPCGTARRAWSRTSPITARSRRSRRWALFGLRTVWHCTPVRTANTACCAGRLLRPAIIRIGQVHRHRPTGNHRCSRAPPGQIVVRWIRQSSGTRQRIGLRKNRDGQGRRYRRLCRGMGQRAIRRRHHGDCCHDSHGDKTFDAAREFSIERNPQDAWSYGYLQPGQSPDASTFKTFAKGEIIGSRKHVRRPEQSRLEGVGRRAQ